MTPATAIALLQTRRRTWSGFFGMWDQSTGDTEAESNLRSCQTRGGHTYDTDTTGVWHTALMCVRVRYWGTQTAEEL